MYCRLLENKIKIELCLLPCNVCFQQHENKHKIEEVNSLNFLQMFRVPVIKKFVKNYRSIYSFYVHSHCQ